MSLWGCTGCHNLVHCSVPGYCPICGSPCERIVSFGKTILNDFGIAHKISDMLYSMFKEDKSSWDKLRIPMKIYNVVDTFKPDVESVIVSEPFETKSVENIISYEVNLTIKGKEHFIALTFNLTTGIVQVDLKQIVDINRARDLFPGSQHTKSD